MKQFSWVRDTWGRIRLASVAVPANFSLNPEMTRYALSFIFAAIPRSPGQWMDTGDNPQGMFSDATENPFSWTACWHVLLRSLGWTWWTDFRSGGILHRSDQQESWCFFSCLPMDHLLADWGIPNLISLLQVQKLWRLVISQSLLCSVYRV